MLTKNQGFMIHSVRFTCVLDTNVIYPIDVRDLLFWFAHYDLFTPKWSKHIFDEWTDVMKRKNISEKEITKRVNFAYRAFPDAMVDNYESLIATIDLPDKKDCHILAAAIKTNANLIVTNNLKDFPKDYLASFGLAAKSPDDFASDIIDLNQVKAVDAFRKLVLNRRNPEMDEYKVLDRFRERGLVDSANYLHSLI